MMFIPFCLFLIVVELLALVRAVGHGVERIARLSGHSGFLILPFNHSVQRLD